MFLFPDIYIGVELDVMIVSLCSISILYFFVLFPLILSSHYLSPSCFLLSFRLPLLQVVYRSSFLNENVSSIIHIHSSSYFHVQLEWLALLLFLFPHSVRLFIHPLYQFLESQQQYIVCSFAVVESIMLE